MKNQTISHHQLLVVVFLALFPLGTEVLFSRLAFVGAAGWLCPLLAGGGAIVLTLLAARREVSLPGKEWTGSLPGYSFSGDCSSQVLRPVGSVYGFRMPWGHLQPS